MTTQQPGTITLVNPVADNFQTWILRNAARWTTRALVDLYEVLTPEELVEVTDEFANIRPSMAYKMCPKFHAAVDRHLADSYVAQQGANAGQHVVICGAGPSLNEHIKHYADTADAVWGCNSAMPHLYHQGIRVTHGFTVDQTAHMCVEWDSVPDVEYLLATTVHPHLTEMLERRERRIRLFHNFVGVRERPVIAGYDENGAKVTLPFEEYMYAALYPGTIMSGAGLNSVTRAIQIAQYMGFAKITILGADSEIRFKHARTERQRKKALKEKDAIASKHGMHSKQHTAWLAANTVMHADGGSAVSSDATPVTMQGALDGRTRMTKPDMIISAQWLVRMAHAYPDQIEVVGDTLVGALLDKSDRWLVDHMPNYVTPDGKAANIPVFITETNGQCHSTNTLASEDIDAFICAPQIIGQTRQSAPSAVP